MGRSRDFVPEFIPKPRWHCLPEEPLFGSQEADAVWECLSCGRLWDGDAPRLCPWCEEYTVPLDGAEWDGD